MLESCHAAEGMNLFTIYSEEGNEVLLVKYIRPVASVVGRSATDAG
jgi:hypothetical protein